MSKEKVEITIDGRTVYTDPAIAKRLQELESTIEAVKAGAQVVPASHHIIDPARAQGATVEAVVYNHDFNPHSFDLGPIDPAAPSVRKRVKFAPATMEGQHTRVRSETKVKPGEWAILKEMPQFQALCTNERTKDGREKHGSQRMSFKVTK